MKKLSLLLFSLLLVCALPAQKLFRMIRKCDLTGVQLYINSHDSLNETYLDFGTGTDAQGKDSAVEAEWTPLEYAAYYGCPEVLQLLLAYPQKFPDYQGSLNRALIAAIDVHDTVKFNMIFAKMPDVAFQCSFCYDRTPLMVALFQGQYAMADKIMTRQPDLFAEDRFHNNMLHAAVTTDSSAAIRYVELLLDTGVSLMAYSSLTRQTPLDRAVDYGNRHVVAFMLSHGASIGMANNNGGTVLATAASNGDTAMMNLLFANGAESFLNTQDSSGYTALMEAVLFNEQAAALLLLKKGADVNPQSRAGDDALLLAIEEAKDPVLIRAIIDAGADLKRYDYYSAAKDAHLRNRALLTYIREKSK